nr:MAG TPA: hypothetical protein [Caudoviricetes sp.]
MKKIRNMRVYEIIKVNDENAVMTFLRCLRDFGKHCKAKCSDCGGFTIVHLGFKRNRDYRRFVKILSEMGYHIDKKKDSIISELNFRCL